MKKEKTTMEKKVFNAPTMKVYEVASSCIICASDISSQSDSRDLQDITYGGKF